MSETIKPEIGQIWRLREYGGAKTVIANETNHRELRERACTVFWTKIPVTEGHLAEFVSWAPGYGPQKPEDVYAEQVHAVEHPAVCVPKAEPFDMWAGLHNCDECSASIHDGEPCGDGIVRRQIVIPEVGRFCEQCAGPILHARDGLTATDRRMLAERLEREKRECDAAHKQFDDMGMLMLIEQGGFVEPEDADNYVKLTGCTLKSNGASGD